MDSEKSFNNEDEISLIELWNIFKNRFIYFLVTLIIVISIAYAYLQTITPKYSASVTVLVDPIETTSSLDEMLISGISSGTSKIQTEIELITSYLNLQNSINMLDLSKYENDKGESYDDFYKLNPESDVITVSSVKDTNLVTISVTDENAKFSADLANAIAASYDELLTGIAKTSKTTQKEFLEKQIPLNEIELQRAANNLSDYKEESGILQLDKKSASLVTQIAYFDIKEEPLKLKIEKNYNLLNSYIQKLSEYQIMLPSILELTSCYEFVELKDSYKSANNELIMYNLANSAEFNNSNNENSETNIRISNLYTTISRLSNKMLDCLNEKLDIYISDNYNANKLISDFEQVVIENVKSEIELSLLEERSKIYSSELDKLPVIERKVTDLERNVNVLQQVGLDLRSMLEQVKLTEAAVSGNVTVIDKARIPKVPVSPNKLLIMAVATLLGMALGFLLCILINIKDNVICTREDIIKSIGKNIPILGCLSLIDINHEEEKVKYVIQKTSEESKIDYSAIFVYDNPNSMQSEQLLNITSNLLYGKRFKKNQVISISSCDMSAGKSTIISNIAIALEQTGAKVIIIDGDLRLPSIASTFGYSRNDKGIVEVVIEKEKLENVIVQPIKDIPNLHILPVGRRPQVPSSILSYNHFKLIIDKLKANYDYILIDAPPVSYSLEVLTIGKLSDAVIINIRAGITTKESLKELLGTLSSVNDKISGFVLNGFIPTNSDVGGYASDYGYGKYGYNKYNYNCDYTSSRKLSYPKRVSLAKARRLAVKQYKINILNRTKRDLYFKNLKISAPLVEGLNLDNKINNELNINNTQNQSKRNIVEYKKKEYKKVKKNNTKEIKKNSSRERIKDKKEKDISRKKAYREIIEDLKKDNNAKGKES